MFNQMPVKCRDSAMTIDNAMYGSFSLDLQDLKLELGY